MLYAAYLWSVSPSRVLPQHRTPFEMLHGKKLDLSHLRVFGARCFAQIPPELRPKNGPHSREAIFVGYPDGVKGWRLRDVRSGFFFNSWDVIFDEGSVLRPHDNSESLRITPPTLPATAPVVPADSSSTSSVENVTPDSPSLSSAEESLPSSPPNSPD
jgi:hypothetical protein